MKACEACRVQVRTNSRRCPLCYGALVDVDGAVEAPRYPVPDDAWDVPASYNLAIRILVFASVVLTGVAVLLNALLWRGSPWCLYVVGGVLFTWLLVKYVILGRVNIARRLTVLVLGSAAFAVLIEQLAGYFGAVDYVLPFLFTAATTAITLILAIRHMRWQAYVIYQLITAVLGCVPLVLYFVRVATVAWPSIASAAYSFITLIGMFIFADRRYKNELARRFHF